jgi:HEAT repeat protein
MSDLLSTTQILLAALESSDPEVRNEAKPQLLALGSEVVPPLIEVMNAQRGRVSIEAAMLLGQIRDPQALSALGKALTFQQPIIGNIALDTLLEDPPPDLARVLREALLLCRGTVQLTVIEAMSQYADYKSVPTLLELLQLAQIASVRYTIIKTLGLIGDSDLIPTLQQYANDPDHHVRDHVQRAVSRLSQLLPGRVL